MVPVYGGIRFIVTVYLFQSLDELTDKAVPKNIQFKRGLQIEDPLSEFQLNLFSAKHLCGTENWNLIHIT